MKASLGLPSNLNDTACASNTVNKLPLDSSAS